MKLRNNPHIAIVVLIWLGLIVASAVWNINQARRSNREVKLATARSLFSIIVTTREWNAHVGGVYVPITEEIQPNPYLEDPRRDITTIDGEMLTKINPAYMTRLIAGLADETESIKFNITSLNPIRPQNAANDWERTALELFETGQEEYYFEDSAKGTFKYMAPLLTNTSCLPCHEKQGYQVGDIRGGISVTFSAQPVRLWPIAVSHALIGLVGAVLLANFGLRLNDAFERLEQQSEIDGLTQIYNRQYFDKVYRREFQRARRLQSPLSIIMIDIDSFKRFNDMNGHQAGDECLKRVAASLRSCLKRPGDIVARYGGEEFVAILPDTHLEGARAVADMLRVEVESLRISHPGSDVSPYLTISLGVATYDHGQLTETGLIERADQAMYKAKHQGKNTAYVYNA